jgi:uncharacterized glyoxalase superfamily protein PhnB
VFERVRDSGVPIVHSLTDEAWGQRRFMTRDQRCGARPYFHAE